MISLEISREEGVMVMVFNATFNNVSAISSLYIRIEFIQGSLNTGNIIYVEL
jgi:hypothetical protein